MNPFDPNDQLGKIVNEYPLIFICLIFFGAMILDSL